MSTPAQKAHALTSYFEKLYKQHYGKAPVVNRNSARWGFDSVLMSMDPVEARELIEYYFQINRPGHPLDWFFYNYDKLLVSRREAVEDAERRVKLREESRKRTDEWRKRVGNQGRTSNQLGPKE